MITEGELMFISLQTTSTTHGCPYYTVLLYCMVAMYQSAGGVILPNARLGLIF